MNYNSQWQFHCEILTDVSQMTNLWQLPSIRNIPAFVFYRCANHNPNNNPLREIYTNKIYKIISSNALQSTFLFLNKWLYNSFSEPYCQFSRMLWALIPAKLKSTPGWANPSFPLVFPSVSVSPYHCWECSLSVRTRYSRQCTNDLKKENKTKNHKSQISFSPCQLLLISRTFLLWQHFSPCYNEVKSERIPEGFDLVNTLNSLNIHLHKQMSFDYWLHINIV